MSKIKLGRKAKEDSVEYKPKEIIYPSFYISSKKLPIAPKDVGKVFKCEIEAKLTGIREDSNEKRTKYNYDFDMKSITL